MALAEAQACGTPVAAFDVGGVRDAVSAECAEYLVANGDMEGLLNALGAVAEKTSQTGNRWRVNGAWAREHFEASVIAKRQLMFTAASRRFLVLSSLFCCLLRGDEG